MRDWYASVGVEPEPKNAKAPLKRTDVERQRINDGYTAWLIENGYDPDTERSPDGFDPWGGHPLLTQDSGSITHPLTGKTWNPNGFNRDDTYGDTGEFYDGDGPTAVDRRGFMRPNAKGERIHIGTGTVFNLARPPRTWDNDDAPAHWAKHHEWRTPEVEAEMQETKRKQAAAEARLAEMWSTDDKLERMGMSR